MKNKLTKLSLLALLTIVHFQSYGKEQITIASIDSLQNAEFFIGYSFKTDFEDIASSGTLKELVIEGDTTKAVLYLMEEYMRTCKRLSVAEEILKYITVSGKISNEAGFAEAVKNYLAIKN